MTAAELGPNDLLLAHWTMARATFEDRCIASAAGGFAGFGILPFVYQDARATGSSDADLLAMLAHYGVRMAQLESVSIAGPDTEATTDALLEVHWHMAELFGADQLGVVVRPGYDRSYQLQRFRDVCDAAAARGITVGIEFIVGVAAFEDVRSTLRFVETADRLNGGLIVDTFHHFRGSDDWSQLDDLPGARVMIIQLSDAAVPPATGDYLTDTQHHRLVPGTGGFELERFVRTMDRIGARCPYTLEVLSDELAQLDAAERGRRLGEGARALLRRARAA
jgi:sugar phosphate isomerase/epimerase